MVVQGEGRVRSAIAQPWDWTPAQVAALAFGIWWIGNGIAVFLVAEPSVGTLDANGEVSALGVPVAVNGWHGLLHLATGLAGVAACWWPGSARAYTLVVGTLYLVAAFCGLFIGGAVFGLVQVDELGSVEHAVEGVVLVTVWMASRGTPGYVPG